MKKIILAASAAFMVLTAGAQLKTPAPSTTQVVKQDFALSTIELSYSRPGVKGRDVFGDLVPYGKVWRTGANQATTLTFGEEVMIGGTKVPAGKYGLLTIPDKNSWTIIITKQLNVTSPTAYEQDKDVVRVNAKPGSSKEKVETFTIEFANVKSTTCDLQIKWDNTEVSFPITVEVDKKVMAQIDQQIIKDSRPYFAAAMYYMENNKDLNTALEWFDKAAAQNTAAFWVEHQRANCLAKLGKKEEAKKAAQKSMTMAKDAKNDDYVRLNEKLLEELK
jgi:hypothetical protein